MIASASRRHVLLLLVIKVHLVECKIYAPVNFEAMLSAKTAYFICQPAHFPIKQDVITNGHYCIFIGMCSKYCLTEK